MLGLLVLIASTLTATPAGVAVLRAAPWSPGDAAREGAGEFEVLMCGARLQLQHRAAGIIGVGDRHGLFTLGAERALRQLALRGLPVVKLSRDGDVVADPEELFLDARGLSEAEASAVLRRCLERHGASPAAVNPERPTAKDFAAIRAHLQPFREAFALAVSPDVAAN
ncbi:MAG: hypothetical protein ABIR80_03170 [Opitutaceae bacterium]